MEIKMKFETVPVQVALRPPRVVILFDGGEHWNYWARTAFHCATRVWGGRGFVVIPHHDGIVRPDLLAMVRAYDPDYVLTLERTVADMEQISPGSCIKLATETSEAEREQRLSESGAFPIEDPSDRAARDQVTEFCSPYRRREEGGAWDEAATHISATEVWHTLTAIEKSTNQPEWPQVYISAPEHWGGALGVALAARCGAGKRPLAGTDPNLPRDQEHVLWNWLLSNDRNPGDQLKLVNHELAYWTHPQAGHPSGGDHQYPTAFVRTLSGLTHIYNAAERRKTVDLVLGDTADDFALAHISERLYGRSVWLPYSRWSEMQEDPSYDHLHTLVSGLARKRRALAISSFSQPDEELQALAVSLQNPPFVALVSEQQQALVTRHQQAVRVEPAAALPESAWFLAVEEQYDIEHPVGVHRTAQGAIEMVAGQRYPDIAHPHLVGCDELQWQVEVFFIPNGLPGGRGIDGHDLLASGQSRHHTWMRSGRDGISFESGKWDLVLSGSSRASSLARPRLRQPSLAAWADLVAAESAMTMEYSPAGSRFLALARLWGSPEAVAEAIASPMRKVFKAFSPTGKASKDAYPNREGVVLGSPGLTDGTREGYLCFDGMLKYRGIEDVGLLRGEVDSLLELGVLKRGLILKCAHCGRPAFIAIDALAQLNKCLRCDGSSQLVSPSWGKTTEPPWFYDLHPIVRDFLNENGDVPVLLAHHLRGNSRTYTDAPEMELFSEGKRKAEADLIALSNRKVLIAEAKSSNTLGADRGQRNDAARKKALLADVLHADEIVLGTTHDTWQTASIQAIQTAVAERKWSWAVARIRTVTGLGTEHIEDTYVR
ncbi:hypothetical protein [Glycomyces niveus]|uniref:Uncharacterized protein n=1 Tax=Glycomyces niveus TaxID=2820287 RepID=A0ABS3U204_9ACTN|nr:hypothetical protein [Glycomyces sp. NEAU-S30]MBO3732789.1 hypothetical protein [Glycomyces sp. NEAU-S30]